MPNGATPICVRLALCVCVGQRELHLLPLPRVKADVKRRGEQQRTEEERRMDGEKERYRECRGWGFGWRGSCVREAQLGNEKCKPPPPLLLPPSFSLSVPPPYTHTYGTHIQTHTIPISLSSPQERWGGGSGGVGGRRGGSEGKGEAGEIGRDGEGDR